MTNSDHARALEASATPARPGLLSALGRPPYAAIVALLDRVSASAWFAYGSILLIQSKLLWGIWDYRDLTNGDTASYFRDANSWADSLHVNSVYSPLYTAAWGSLKWLIHDVYAVTIAHRVIIVLAATLLVLAVLRRLLPPGIAWLLALWWTVVPINYDTVYEVHLFALLPTLAAVLVALTFRGILMRAGVFLLLAAAGLLVRTELLVAVVPWAVLWAGYEIWMARRGLLEALPRWERRASRAVPIVLAAGLFAGVLITAAGGSRVRAADSKQKIILCQNYYAGVSQREKYPQGLDPNRPLSCGGVMLATFGDSRPTWVEAIRANPSAMGEHLLWNAQLIPQGMELMLFNQISGTLHVNPDSVPVTNSVAGAFLGLAAVTALIFAGLVLLWRERRRWWEDWLRQRAWGWAVLGCLGIAALIVMLMIRPRPSYLFNFSVLTLAVIGTCAMVIGSRWGWSSRLRAAIPLLAVAVLIAVPSHFHANYVTPQAGQGRPLLQMYDRLKPFRSVLAPITTRFLAPQFAVEGCIYATEGANCGRSVSYLEAITGAEGQTSLPELIKERQVNLIYADEQVLTNPLARDLMERLDRKGWEALGPAPSSGASWTLLRRPPSFPPYSDDRT
jgi:hypothetical protein